MATFSGFNDGTTVGSPASLAVLRGEERVVISVNLEFCHAFGLAKDSTEGRPVSEVVSLDGLEEVISQTRLPGEPMGYGEIRYMSTEGVERRYLACANPLDGDTLVILNDMTDQRRHQEKLQEASRLVSIGELAAGVAHEINNPLTVVTGYSEMLMSARLPEPAAHQARRIHSEAQRAARIIHNLLAFARRHEPEKRYLDVTAVLEWALGLKAYDFSVGGIQVTRRWPQYLPRTMVDDHQLIQVIMNILTNGEQAMLQAHGRGHFTISATSSGDRITISIADDGPGIATDNLHRIFDPFFTTKDVG